MSGRNFFGKKEFGGRGKIRKASMRRNHLYPRSKRRVSRYIKDVMGYLRMLREE